MTKIEIAEKLKTARSASKMTQAQVAQAIGRSAKLVGHWETGYSQPDADTLSVLLKLYNIDANSFFEIEKAPAVKRELSANISIEESNSLLVALGFINEGEQLTDDDLAFLGNIISLLDNWFRRKK